MWVSHSDFGNNQVDCEGRHDPRLGLCWVKLHMRVSRLITCHKRATNGLECMMTLFIHNVSAMIVVSAISSEFGSCGKGVNSTSLQRRQGGFTQPQDPVS